MSGRGEDGDLVAAAIVQRAEDGAENHAGILISGNNGSAGVNHFLGAIEKSAEVDTLNRAGHDAEIRKRGVAAADAGQAEEDMPESVLFGDLLHLRAGIGDGDEAFPGFAPRQPVASRARKSIA